MRKKTIQVLLIDDNPGDAKLIAHTLNDQPHIKFEVEIKVRLGEGIQRAKEKRFHIALLDLDLPDSNGLDTFAKLKSKIRGLPIIVLTGLNSEEVAVQAVRKGAQDYIVKDDMNTPLLVRAVSYALERASAEEKRLWLEMKMLHAQKLESLNLLNEKASHEFCTLLMAIIGNAELALEKINGENAAQPNIKKIISSAQQASLLTNKMLGYAGKKRSLVESLNLAQLVGEMRPLIVTVVPKKIRVKYNLNIKVPPVKADVPRIQQMVLNLVQNAAEATSSKGGEILIQVFGIRADNRWLHDSQLKGDVSPGMHACLQVVDKGCGINPKNRPKIFYPFFTTKFINSGLGLAAIDGIVKGHGGAIRISSQTGKGTTISVLLPATKGKKQSQAQSAVHTVAFRKRILILEEEPEIENLMKSHLESSGYSAISAENFEQALKLMGREKGRADLVILEMPRQETVIPGMLKDLRQRHPSVKVILTSDLSAVDCSLNPDSLDAEGFLKKPFRAAELIEVVQKVLKRQTGAKED